MGDDLLPVLSGRLTVVGFHHMVEIHHTESVQTNPFLLTPTAYNIILIGPFQIVGNEGHQWQRGFLSVTICLYLLLVSQLIHRRPSLRLQPIVPVLIISGFQPFQVKAAALNLPDGCHLSCHFRIPQQREEELVAYILCRHTEIPLITKRHII